MICPGKSSQDQKSKRNNNSGGKTHETSKGIKHCTENEPRSHLCGVYAVNLSGVCPCPENFNKIEHKNNRIICLAEGICQDRTA